MNFKKKVGGSWTDTSHYIHNTSTDIITTLPAVIYPTGTTATVGLKGQTTQSSIPSPTSPVTPQGTGERTGNLFDKSDNSLLYLPTNLATSTQWNYGGTGAVFRIPCEASKTYTLSCDIDSTVWRISFLSTDSVPTAQSISVPSTDVIKRTSKPSSGSYTFTTNSDTKYILFQIGMSVLDQAKEILMLVEGSTAPSTYIPYGYKIPISSANTTTPVYLGEVQTTRKIKKLILTGTENIKSGTGFIYAVANDAASYLATARCICTHYPQEGTESCINTTNQIRFYVNSDVDTFKAYLAAQYANGTPVCVWYILKNEETAVVNEPLMRIGGYADTVSGITIPTIAGANTIDIDTTLKPSEVTVNYHGWHPVSAVHERESGAWT